MRVREKYYVTDRKTGHKYEVLDGDRITEIPTNNNPDLVFECFTKDNKKFDEPIYKDMTLDIVWSSKTYNFKESNLNAYLSLLESKAYYPFKDMMIDKICNLERFRDSKFNRNDFYIEDNGFNISGGERQKIILARSILCDFNY